jgi:sugar phosphate isomerase/epimerase
MFTPASVAPLSRRRFLALTGLVPAALLSNSVVGRSLAADEATSSVPSPKSGMKKPVGLELYAVRGELARDLPGTLRQVAAMGYSAVEFYSPYFKWTVSYAQEVRKLMDDLGLHCPSTHNGAESFAPGDGIAKAIELNRILGARYIVMASPPKGTAGLDGWKNVCSGLTAAVEQFRPHGMSAGFHNHQTEWAPLADGMRIMDFIAANTPADFVLQLDVGTCVAAGQDPVAWIKAHPGRIRSVHLKDWAPGTAQEEKGFRVLFGEGASPWAGIIAAAESVGGVECYMMEQEGSRYPEMETARRCLDNWRKLRENV